MPGVPSGRGCDACRRQKKKCHPGMPACARCARLGIQCHGAGQQRYKFIHRTAAHDAESESFSTSSSGTGAAAPPLRIMPSSETALITGHLISRLEVKDIRYDTGCFGAFLHFIPARIGTNRALDIAADTFATVYSHLHVGSYPVEALVKHGRALHALRRCLTKSKPRKGQVAEIVAAIYLTMLNDDMLNSRTNRPRVSHMGVLVYLLQMTAHWDWESEFELEALLTITGIVVMESAGNPQVKLDPWIWKVLEKISPPRSGTLPQGIVSADAKNDPDRFPSLELHRIIEITQLIREPAHRCSDLQFNYDLLLGDRDKLKHQPTSLFFSDSDDASTDKPPPQIQLGFQTRLATVLTLALMVNMSLQEYFPQDILLCSERDVLVEESIAVSQIPDRYRPLGACYVTHCLIVACAASCNPTQQAVIAALLGELSGIKSTPMTGCVEDMRGWRARWENLRRQVPGRPLLSAAICRHAGGRGPGPGD